MLLRLGHISDMRFYVPVRKLKFQSSETGATLLHMTTNNAACDNTCAGPRSHLSYSLIMAACRRLPVYMARFNG